MWIGSSHLDEAITEEMPPYRSPWDLQQPVSGCSAFYSFKDDIEPHCIVCSITACGSGAWLGRRERGLQGGHRVEGLATTGGNHRAEDSHAGLHALAPAKGTAEIKVRQLSLCR